MYLLSFFVQDNNKRAVFEKFYANKFGCQIFQRKSSCSAIGTEQDGGDEDGDQDDEQVRKAVFMYAQDNIAVVKVFARDPYYTLIEKDKKMSLLSFVGNTGRRVMSSKIIFPKFKVDLLVSVLDFLLSPWWRSSTTLSLLLSSFVEAVAVDLKKVPQRPTYGKPKSVTSIVIRIMLELFLRKGLNI